MTDPEEDAEDPDPVPPDAVAVTRRMLCLAFVAARGATASDLRDDPSVREEAEAFDAELRAWLSEQNLTADLERSERVFFEKPLDGLDEQDVINASWRTESVGVLLWALSVLDDLPPYDDEFDGIPDIAPVLLPVDEVLGEVELRDPGEIERARDIAELWHWRSRTTQLIAEQAAGERRIEQDLDAIVRESARRASAAGDIPAAIDEDFPAFGKPYRDLPPDEYARVTSIAMERHLALNWLCGLGPSWDETPTDT